MNSYKALYGFVRVCEKFTREAEVANAVVVKLAVTSVFNISPISLIHAGSLLFLGPFGNYLFKIPLECLKGLSLQFIPSLLLHPLPSNG